MATAVAASRVIVYDVARGGVEAIPGERPRAFLGGGGGENFVSRAAGKLLTVSNITRAAHGGGSGVATVGWPCVGDKIGGQGPLIDSI